MVAGAVRASRPIVTTTVNVSVTPYEINRTTTIIQRAGPTNGSSGGGGGGDNPNPPVSGKIRFTADKTSLTFDLQESIGFYGPQIVTITASGDFNGTLYVAAVVEGQGIDPDITLSISGLQGTFTINPAAGLAVGDYTGRIKLMGCSDANCTHQVGNSPLYVSYTTHVHTALHLSAESFDLATTSDTGLSRDVTVTLPWQQSSFSTQIFTSGPGFLTVTQPTPTRSPRQSPSNPGKNKVCSESCFPHPHTTVRSAGSALVPLSSIHIGFSHACPR